MIFKTLEVREKTLHFNEQDEGKGKDNSEKSIPLCLQGKEIYRVVNVKNIGLI